MRKRYATFLLGMMLAGLGLSSAFAQTTIQIGVTNYGGYAYPFYTYYPFSGTEQIWTASDIQNAGWTGSGYITHFRLWAYSGTYYQGGYISIFMQNNSATSLASGAVDTSGTRVYSGTYPGPVTVGAWYEFELQTPFWYTAGSTLQLTVCKYDVPYTYGTSSYWAYNYLYPSYVMRRATGTGSFPTSLTQYYYRSTIQFDFTTILPPKIQLTSGPDGCYSSAANPTVTATIFDPNGGSITDARIWYRKNGGTWYNSAYSSVSGTSYTFSINHSTMGGYNVGDKIEWYLAASNNSGGVKTYPSGGSGTSPVGSTPPSKFNSYTNYQKVTSFPYAESFETANHGWTFGGVNGSWGVGPVPSGIGGSAYDGTQVLYFGSPYLNNAQSWAMSPVYDFSGMVTDPYLVFDHKWNFESSWDGGRVEYSTDGGSTWKTLGIAGDPLALNWYNYTSVNSSGGNPVWSSSTSSWTHSVRPLTGLAGKGCVRLRFYACSDGSVTYSGWAIDNVRIGNFVQYDAAVTKLAVSYAPNTWCFQQNQNHDVTGTVIWNGWDVPPASVTLVYKVGSLPANPTDGNAETFALGGTTNRVFGTKFNPTVLGNQRLFLRVFATPDLIPGDDTTSLGIQVVNTKTFGYEDFENLNPVVRFSGQAQTWSPGWTMIDGASGGTSPGWVGENAYPWNVGVGAVTFPNPGADYLISPSALLQAGSSYRVRFQYGGSGNGMIRLLAGKTNVPAQMTEVARWTPLTNPSLQDAKITLGALLLDPYFNTDPAGAAGYYIAFESTCPGYGWSFIDNIILDENPTPPPKIGYGSPGTPNGSHIDNPTIPINMYAVYKKPGAITQTYEVVSTTYSYGAPGDFLWDVTTTTPWIKIVKSVAAPTQYLTSNPFNPARPRQKQTFDIQIDASTMQPGTYNGTIKFYGSLYNSTFPGGIAATNDGMSVPVILTVTAAGSGAPGTPSAIQVCGSNMTVGNTYTLKDANGIPIAGVTVTQGAIPSICITAFPAQLPQGLGRYRYVQRYWNVTATGAGWAANIDWYYTGSEATAGGVTRPDLLRCIRQITSGGVWEDPTMGTTSASYPSQSFVRGIGYNPSNLNGNHCVVTNYTPKIAVSSDGVPTAYSLGQNYPNPFNPSTKIDFAVPEEVSVKLVVFNAMGQEVATLVNETLPAGAYSATFDASKLPSGTYIYRMTAGSFVETRSMVVSK